WGSRARLLTNADAAEWTNVARIGVSLALAAALLVLAVRARRRTVSGAPLILVAFSAWMVSVWAPSVLSVAAGDGDAPFKIVHSVLAIVSIGLGAALVGHARRETTFSRSRRRSTARRIAVPDTGSNR
ncbi:MAG: hypothetical protein OEM97_05400, partial [Acidimicrobiia bacterium]|nr:hypothetical protein [Acidimicrobiia bacterium]